MRQIGMPCVVGLILSSGCGASTIHLDWEAFEYMGRAPSFNETENRPTYYQAEVDVPDWGSEALVVCADGVEWFAIFEAGGDPDIPPLFSYPGTRVLKTQYGAGCTTVVLNTISRLSVRIGVTDTTNISVRLTNPA